MTSRTAGEINVLEGEMPVAVIAIILLAILGWYLISRRQMTRIAGGDVPATKLERQLRIMLSTPVARDEDAVGELFSRYEHSLRLRQERLIAEGPERHARELAIIDQLQEQWPKWFADASTAAMVERMNRSRF